MPSVLLWIYVIFFFNQNLYDLPQLLFDFLTYFLCFNHFIFFFAQAPFFFFSFHIAVFSLPQFFFFGLQSFVFALLTFILNLKFDVFIHYSVKYFIILNFCVFLVFPMQNHLFCVLFIFLLIFSIYLILLVLYFTFLLIFFIYFLLLLLYFIFLFLYVLPLFIYFHLLLLQLIFLFLLFIYFHLLYVISIWVIYFYCHLAFDFFDLSFKYLFPIWFVFPDEIFILDELVFHVVFYLAKIFHEDVDFIWSFVKEYVVVYFFLPFIWFLQNELSQFQLVKGGMRLARMDFISFEVVESNRYKSIWL